MLGTKLGCFGAILVGLVLCVVSYFVISRMPSPTAEQVALVAPTPTSEPMIPLSAFNKAMDTNRDISLAAILGITTASVASSASHMVNGLLTVLIVGAFLLIVMKMLGK
jgi:hypothetical protein